MAARICFCCGQSSCCFAVAKRTALRLASSFSVDSGGAVLLLQKKKPRCVPTLLFVSALLLFCCSKKNGVAARICFCCGQCSLRLHCPQQIKLLRTTEGGEEC